MKPLKLLPLLAALALTGCFGEKSKFVKACTGDDVTKAQCKCMYDVADETLSPEQKDIFVTAVIEGSEAAAEKSQGGGLLGAISNGAGIANFAVKAEKQCKA